MQVPLCLSFHRPCTLKAFNHHVHLVPVVTKHWARKVALKVVKAKHRSPYRQMMRFTSHWHDKTVVLCIEEGVTGVTASQTRFDEPA